MIEENEYKWWFIENGLGESVLKWNEQHEFQLNIDKQEKFYKLTFKLMDE